MPRFRDPLLDHSVDTHPDPDEYVRAAMKWHFDPETGSPYWLRRAEHLDFDPRTDVKSHEDLQLFPDVTSELRDVPVRHLIPQGYDNPADVVGFFESGGTSGAPKRVVLLRDWMEHLMAWSNATLDAHGFPRDVDWLGLTPTGPHVVGEFFRWSAHTRGGVGFPLDLDPRWVKRMIASGRGEEADSYAEHVVEQAGYILRTQDVGIMTVTPPLLERLARNEDLVELINENVRAIRWGGTQMDPDTRLLYQDEVFPDIVFYGNYGNTMAVGFGAERPPSAERDTTLCVFDALSPAVTYRVVNPDSGAPVAVGERGQVVQSHVSRSFLLPHAAERDTAIRCAPAPGQVGDSVADIAPLSHVGDVEVIEGVY